MRISHGKVGTAPNLRVILALLPGFIWFCYLFVAATPVFETEFRLQIRSGDSGGGLTGGALASILGSSSAGASNAHAVVQFVLSWDALARVERDCALREHLSDEGVDFLKRQAPSASKEQRMRQWSAMVRPSYEPSTEIVTVRVSAYSPQRAKEVAECLLQGSEELVNSLAERARKDALQHAENDLLKADNDLIAVELRLLESRRKNGVADPRAQLIDSMTRISRLQAELDQLETEFVVRSAQTAKDSPLIGVLRTRIAHVTSSLTRAKEDMLNGSDRGVSLAASMSEIDKLNLERGVLAKRIESATAALQAATASAARQHVYLNKIVGPYTPEEPAHPRFPHDCLTSVLISVFLYAVSFVFNGR
jgi:capsular polysaccharide transport system permease protein